jgi:tRNA U54 and U55 pseudouridine synthase Pus10
MPKKAKIAFELTQSVTVLWGYVQMIDDNRKKTNSHGCEVCNGYLNKIPDQISRIQSLIDRLEKLPLQ